MTLADELRGEVAVGPSLHGHRRYVSFGENVFVPNRLLKARKRAKAWSERNPGAHRAYVKAYDAARREQANARVARYTAKHPERRAAQLRAAARRYWRKKHPKAAP